MKVASYNIHKCRGADGVRRPDRIIGVIRELGASIITLQEVDRRFGRGRGVLDPTAIERETGMQLLVQEVQLRDNRSARFAPRELQSQSPIRYRISAHEQRIAVPAMALRSVRFSRLRHGGGACRGARLRLANNV